MNSSYKASRISFQQIGKLLKLRQRVEGDYGKQYGNHTYSLSQQAAQLGSGREEGTGVAAPSLALSALEETQ